MLLNQRSVINRPFTDIPLIEKQFVCGLTIKLLNIIADFWTDSLEQFDGTDESKKNRITGNKLTDYSGPINMYMKLKQWFFYLYSERVGVERSRIIF